MKLIDAVRALIGDTDLDAERRSARVKARAGRRAQNMPRRNTPKGQHPRRVHVRYQPWPLSAEGIARLGHAPRPRRRIR